MLYAACGGDGRWLSAAVAVCTGSFFFVGPGVVTFVPRPAAGALMFHLGLELVDEALIQPLGDAPARAARAVRRAAHSLAACARRAAPRATGVKRKSDNDEAASRGDKLTVRAIVSVNGTGGGGGGGAERAEHMEDCGGGGGDDEDDEEDGGNPGLQLTEYTSVVAVTFTMTAFDFVVGLGLGLALGCAVFVLQAARAPALLPRAPPPPPPPTAAAAAAERSRRAVVARMLEDTFCHPPPSSSSDGGESDDDGALSAAAVPVGERHLHTLSLVGSLFFGNMWAVRAAVDGVVDGLAVEQRLFYHHPPGAAAPPLPPGGATGGAAYGDDDRAAALAAPPPPLEPLPAARQLPTFVIFDFAAVTVVDCTAVEQLAEVLPRARRPPRDRGRARHHPRINHNISGRASSRRRLSRGAFPKGTCSAKLSSRAISLRKNTSLREQPRSLASHATAQRNRAASFASLQDSPEARRRRARAVLLRRAACARAPAPVGGLHRAGRPPRTRRARCSPLV